MRHRRFLPRALVASPGVPTPSPSLRTGLVELGGPALAIHGGAGRRPDADGEGVRAVEIGGLDRSLAAGWAVIEAGGSAVDAVVAAVASMEDSGLFNAGRGAVPTTAGQVETDAAVMSDRRSGAACAMTFPANPVRVALAVADAGDALLLAGPGADRFAAEAGLAERDPATLTHGGTATISEMGTVGAVALDAGGHLAAATSTGGRRGQPPGRVGDSPIIGAGTWAVSDGVAVSATGDGEAFVRAGFSHLIDGAVRLGSPLDAAVADAIRAVEAWDGTGGAVVLSPTGDLVVAHDTPAMAWGWRGAAGSDSGIAGPRPG